MGSWLPPLSAAQLLELGRPYLTWKFEENERIRCNQLYAKNFFRLQVHFQHLPPLQECAHLAKIHCQTSLVGEDGLAAPLGYKGLYCVRGYPDTTIDEQDMSLHNIEPVLGFYFPHFEARYLEGKYKVRFEVVWVQKRGCMKHKTVIHTVDTPVIELWGEKRARSVTQMWCKKKPRNKKHGEKKPSEWTTRGWKLSDHDLSDEEPGNKEPNDHEPSDEKRRNEESNDDEPSDDDPSGQMPTNKELSD